MSTITKCRTETMRFLLFALTICQAGCNDLAAALRDELALESERIDRLVLINDEASAKDYGKSFNQYYSKRLEKIRDKKAELIERFDKQTKPVWDEYESIIKESEGVADVQEVFKEGRTGGAKRIVKEIKERLEAKGKFPSKEGEWERVLGELPPPKILHRYLRERMALKLAMDREKTRLNDFDNAAIIAVVQSLGK